MKNLEVIMVGEFLFSVMYGGSLIIIGFIVRYFLKKIQADQKTIIDAHGIDANEQSSTRAHTAD